MKMTRIAIAVLAFSGFLMAQSSGPNQGGISILGVLTSGDCVKAAGPAQIQDAGSACAAGGGGTVTTFSAGTLSPLFTTSVANPTTAPALTFSLTNAGAGTLFGNSSGSPAAPSFTLTPVLGLAGTSVGTLGFQNATSGTVTLSPVAGALGTVTISLPAAAGTVAVSATSPITESAAGAVGCATCATTTNGGALSGSAPVAISAGGAISCATCATVSATNHGVVLSGAAQALTVTSAGTAGQELLSGGASADGAYARRITTSIPSSDILSSAGTFATTESLDGTNLAIGSLIEVRAHGVYTTTGTASPQMSMVVNAGGTSGICTTATFTINTNITAGPWEAFCYIQINTTGSPGTAIAWGTETIGTAAAAVTNRIYTNTGTQNFTTGNSQTVSVQETGVTVSGQTFTLQSIYARVVAF